jgi:hypothetical protein
MASLYWIIKPYFVINMKISKNIRNLLVFSTLGIMLASCPESSRYPLAEVKYAVPNANLIGTWVTTDDSADAKAVIITQKNANLYSLEVDELSEFTSWMYKIADYTFLINQVYDSKEGHAGDEFYLYRIQLTDKTLVAEKIILPVELNEIFSTDYYQKMVKQSLKKGNCFRHPVMYSRKK